MTNHHNIQAMNNDYRLTLLYSIRRPEQDVREAVQDEAQDRAHDLPLKPPSHPAVRGQAQGRGGKKQGPAAADPLAITPSKTALETVLEEGGHNLTHPVNQAVTI